MDLAFGGHHPATAAGCLKYQRVGDRAILAVWLQKWGVGSESCGRVSKLRNPNARREQARVGKGPNDGGSDPGE